MSHCEILAWIILRIHTIPTSAKLALIVKQMYVAVTVREEANKVAFRELWGVERCIMMPRCKHCLDNTGLQKYIG